MKQKTRYNVNLASRKGVTVRYGNEADFEMLYRMYCETCTRDGFIIRDEVYYRRLWETFLNKRPSETDGVIPSAEILIAEVNGEAVAGLVLFYFAGKAYYLQGMSRHIHKDKMPNYLLQWEAIRRARLKGCRVYDLWGAPDEFHEQDRLWGVFRFKEGFGGRLVRTIGAWDWAAQPMSYRLYAHILPRLLEVMRRRSRIRTRQMIPL
jgi:lipid II:glycine glycyltransferase (peptidoglycan interpeptide bridge formation enzyme)